MSRRVLVIGGGMVGLAFAVGLRQTDPDVVVSVLEARPIPQGNPDPLDTRASALNRASEATLAGWGVWPDMVAHGHPITSIHVSNQYRFGSALMSASDLATDHFGYVIENHRIGRALKARADALGVVFYAPTEVRAVVPGLEPMVELSDGDTLPADLVVVADGMESRLREGLGVSIEERATGQSAIVANCVMPGQQRGIAFERFTDQGPLALLPLPSSSRDEQRFNVVWSMAPDRATDLSEAESDTLRAALQEAFGWRLGKITAVGKRSSWRLNRVRAREQVRPGVLVVGNAAHGIHPVAGQGLNLSLFDAQALCEQWRQSLQADVSPVSKRALMAYQSKTVQWQDTVIGATDLLSTVFTRTDLFSSLPRDLALALLDLAPGLRNQFARWGAGMDRSATASVLS